MGTSTWTSATLFEARYNCTATACGNKIFIAGGIGSGGTESKVVDIYDVTTNTWSHDLLSIGRFLMSSAAVGNLVFFAAGADAGLSCRYL